MGIDKIRFVTWKKKDGKILLIDGCQRSLSLISILDINKETVDKNNKKVSIRVLFDPIEETFELANNNRNKNENGRLRLDLVKYLAMGIWIYST